MDYLTALSVLKKSGYKIKADIILLHKEEETEEEKQAINYLHNRWGYGVIKEEKR